MLDYKDSLMLKLITIAASETENGETTAPVHNALTLNNLLAAVVFAVIGVLVFLLVYWVIVKVAPFSIRKEIEEDHNTSLAIIIGAALIGIAIIIAAAIHGG